MIVYSRQLDLLDPSKKEHQPNITVIGAGTIGSWTTLCLAKMGFRNIAVVDFDVVESHNSPNQLYFDNHATSASMKVNALRALVKSATGIEITAYPFRVTPYGFMRNEDYGSGKAEGVSLKPFLDGGIMVLGLDSMLARRMSADLAKGSSRLLIDGRIGGNVYTVLAVTPDKMDDYIKSIISDNTKFENQQVQDAFDTKCTARSIADVAFLVAGRISSILRVYVTTGKLPHTEINEDVLNQLTWK